MTSEIPTPATLAGVPPAGIRPPTLAPASADQIPKSLVELDQWVCWRYEWRDSKPKPTKVPVRTNGRLAATDDPTTWMSFENAFAAAQRNPDFGVGFVFAKEGGLVGVDLDDCLDDQGHPKPWAMPIIERFADSYSEISPSGTGIKIFVCGDLDGLLAAPTGTRRGYHDGAIEIYQHGRFFTVTGRAFNGAPIEIENHQSDLPWLLNLVGIRSPAAGAGGTAQQAPPAIRALSEDEAVGIHAVLAAAQANDPKFEALAKGGRCDFISASEGDLAFCNLLARLFKNDPSKIDLAFRSTARMRPKWTEKRPGGTYGQLTIAKAIAPPPDKHASEPSPLEFIIAKVRATGDVNFVYSNIALIAARSGAEVAALYQDLKLALGTRLNYVHFNKAIADARVRQRRQEPEQQDGDLRPSIRTDDRLLDEIAADAISALEASNDPPVVFRRGGRLVMIHPDEDGRPVIMQATDPMVRGRLARVARFLKAVKDGDKRVSPPEDLTRDVLASNEGSFPALGVLTQIPILRPDGTMRMEPGYDPVTRAYYLPTPNFNLPPIPPAPTREDARAAVEALDEVIGEFPFESPADRANCLGLLLTPILRVAFKMKAPLALIDAPKWGSGKTLLGMVAYVITTGSEGTVCSAPTAEEEWRKRVMSILARGSAVVIIDNIDKTLQSAALSAVLTASCWEDRILGRSEDVRLPNVSTWIGTGNNISLGGEMARRVYRIRLDAKVSNPAQRTGFKRTDQELLDWAATNRGALVAAILTMIQGWRAAGQPRAQVPAFGSFNKWTQTVGGILDYAGVQHFLGDLSTVQTEVDEESQQWDVFLRALVTIFRDQTFTVTAIVGQVLHSRDLLTESFPDDIGHPDERASNVEPFSLQRRIGKALARRSGTRFGELELRVERAGTDRHSKVMRWRIGGNLAPLLPPQGAG